MNSNPRAELFDGNLVLLTNAPVHHRLPDRIRTHALICFLVLYRVMRIRLKANEHNSNPPTAIDILSRIQKTSLLSAIAPSTTPAIQHRGNSIFPMP